MQNREDVRSLHSLTLNYSGSLPKGVIAVAMQLCTYTNCYKLETLEVDSAAVVDQKNGQSAWGTCPKNNANGHSYVRISEHQDLPHTDISYPEAEKPPKFWGGSMLSCYVISIVKVTLMVGSYLSHKVLGFLLAMACLCACIFQAPLFLSHCNHTVSMRRI